jgi:hypothetical protein
VTKTDPELTLEKTHTLSRVLSGIPFPADGDRATIREFSNLLDDLALSVAIFFFAAINIIPAPPGTSLFLGIPLVILAFRKAVGSSLWLPSFIMNAGVSRFRFLKYKEILTRWIGRAELYIKPRQNWFKAPYAANIIDWFTVILALCVLIPLPFTAILPAICICMITLGRLEGDGRCISFGSALGLVAITIAFLMVYGSGRLAMLMFSTG